MKTQQNTYRRCPLYDVDLRPNARARPDIKGRSASTSGRGHLDGGHPQRDAPGAAWVRRGDQEDRHAPATEGTHANWRVMAVASSSARELAARDVGAALEDPLLGGANGRLLLSGRWTRDHAENEPSGHRTAHDYDPWNVFRARHGVLDDDLVALATQLNADDARIQVSESPCAVDQL